MFIMLKKSIIAAVIAIVITLAGFLGILPKVECLRDGSSLILVVFVSLVFYWLSAFLVLEEYKEFKRTFDFWALCVIMPCLLPTVLWIMYYMTCYNV